MEYICNLNLVFELEIVAKLLCGVIKFTEHQGSIFLVCLEEDLASEMLPDKKVLRSNKFYSLNDVTESALDSKLF